MMIKSGAGACKVPVAWDCGMSKQDLVVTVVQDCGLFM